jgi:hypothetical protein
MRRKNVPDHQQLAANLLGQRLQELDELRSADRAGIESKVEVIAVFPSGL